MFTVHATKKLRDGVKQRIAEPVVEPTTALGNIGCPLPNPLCVKPPLLTAFWARPSELSSIDAAE